MQLKFFMILNINFLGVEKKNPIQASHHLYSLWSHLCVNFESFVPPLVFFQIVQDP